MGICGSTRTLDVLYEEDEEKDGKIAYVLTNTGVRFIESGFTKEE